MMTNMAIAGMYIENEKGQLIAVEGGVLNATPPSRASKPDAGAPENKATPWRSYFAEPPKRRNAFMTDMVIGRETDRTTVQIKDEHAGSFRFSSSGRLTPSTVKRLLRSNKLPEPRRLPGVKKSQSAMYSLAAKVGAEYSTHRDVRAAGMSRSDFVTMFTTLIQKESNFNARAVSHVGARGLGQLMPATAQSLGVRNSFAPRENLDGAARYLVRMLGKFRKPEFALAAYNAGPGAVSKHGGIPPYRETRHYVADILHNAAERFGMHEQTASAAPSWTDRGQID